jgi:hypothetical protein
VELDDLPDAITGLGKVTGVGDLDVLTRQSNTPNHAA